MISDFINNSWSPQLSPVVLGVMNEKESGGVDDRREREGLHPLSLLGLAKGVGSYLIVMQNNWKYLNMDICVSVYLKKILCKG